MRAPMMALLMLSISFAGCLGGGDSSDQGPGDADLSAPAEWQIGQWWLYTFSTPDWEDDSARLVVAEDDAEDDTAYMLAISSEREAKRHAVLNHNPFLGRITHDNLSAFENGEAQSVLNFPLDTGKSWSFTLFDIDWTTAVIGSSSGRATMSATSTDGQILTYTYDGWAGFIGSLTWYDSEETLQLRMVLTGNGFNHTGNVWFIRAGDIFAEEWDHSAGAPDVEITDSFFVGDHPSQGPYDQMIYWLDAEMGAGTSSGTLTLRDHQSTSMLGRQWGQNAEESGNLGTIPYPSGDYTLTITQTGNSYIRLIVAGGLTSSWEL